MANRKWLLFLALFLFARSLYAYGIGATPALIRFRKIPLGREITAAERIVVRNPNPYDNWYRFSLRKENSHSFYEPLPSLDWISLSRESVYAPAESVSDSVSVKITIPPGWEYYNRHYAASITVSASAKGGIGAGISIIVEVDTQPVYSYPETVKNFAPLFPTFSCAGSIDTFMVYNENYEPVSYSFALTKRLGSDSERYSSPLYEPHFFFLFPVDELRLKGKEKRRLYGIFEKELGGEMYVIMESQAKRSFIRLENCR